MHQNVIPSLRVAVPSHREEGYVIPYPSPFAQVPIPLTFAPPQKAEPTGQPASVATSKSRPPFVYRPDCLVCTGILCK